MLQILFFNDILSHNKYKLLGITSDLKKNQTIYSYKDIFALK